MEMWPALALIAGLALPEYAQEFRPTPSAAELESKLDQDMHDMETLEHSCRTRCDLLGEATQCRAF